MLYMRLLFLIICAALIVLLLAGCGAGMIIKNNRCEVKQTEYGAVVKCGDTETKIFHGRDGEQGEEGRDAYTISTVIIAPGTCQELAEGFSVRTRYHGRAFDVYESKDCFGSRVCKNVSTSTGRYGSGTVCWAGDNIQFSGSRHNDGMITLFVADFL